MASRGNRPVAAHGPLLLAFLAVERGLLGMQASVAAARGSEALGHRHNNCGARTALVAPWHVESSQIRD